MDKIEAGLVKAVSDLYAERATHEATKAELAAFRQEVSEAAEVALSGYSDAYCPASHLEKHLRPLIIPKPDQLGEKLDNLARHVGLSRAFMDDLIDTLGLKITEADNG